KPAAVVVERNGAVDLPGSFGDGADACGFGSDARSLFFSVMSWLTTTHHPELRLEVVTLQNIENEPGFVIHGGWEPPGEQLGLMALESLDLGLERRDMFGAVIVGEAFETKVCEHGGTFLRATLFRIKRD